MSSPPMKKLRLSSPPPGNQEGANSDTSVIDDGVQQKPTINKGKILVLAKASKAVTETAGDSIINKGKKSESGKASQAVPETEDIPLLNKGECPASAKAPKAVTETEDVALLKLENAENLKNRQFNQEGRELLKKTETVITRQEFEDSNSLAREHMNGRKGKEAGSIQAGRKDTDEGKGNVAAGSIQANPGCSSHMPKLEPLLITREELGECRLNTEDPEVPDNEPLAEEEEELVEDLGECMLNTEDREVPDNDWP